MAYELRGLGGAIDSLNQTLATPVGTSVEQTIMETACAGRGGVKSVRVIADGAGDGTCGDSSWVLFDKGKVVEFEGAPPSNGLTIEPFLYAGAGLAALFGLYYAWNRR